MCALTPLNILDVYFQFPLDSLPWGRNRVGGKEQEQMTLWELIMMMAIAMRMTPLSIAETTLKELLIKSCGYKNLTAKVLANAKDGLRRAIQPQADGFPVAVTLLSGEVSDNMRPSDELVFRVDMEPTRDERFLAIYPREFDRLRELSDNMSFDRLFSLYFYLKSTMINHVYFENGEKQIGLGSWVRKEYVLDAMGFTGRGDVTYQRYLAALVNGGMIGYTHGKGKFASCFTIGQNPALMTSVMRSQGTYKQEHKQKH